VRRVLVAALLVLCTPGAASAATHEVGPGRPHADLQAVQELVAPGDTVLLYGGATYPGDVVFDVEGRADAPITIRGVAVDGRRPIVSGGRNTIEMRGDHYFVENLDITAGSFRCLYHHAHAITVRDTVVHHCPAHGILGADTDSGSLTLQRVEVHHSGSGTYEHSIYMATDELTYPGSVFRMEHCWIHDTTGGNAVSTRAERNEIYFNWIEGAEFHELSLVGPDPVGGVPEDTSREDSESSATCCARPTASSSSASAATARERAAGASASPSTRA